MSVIATALKHMLAAGMPHDAIVAAVAEMEGAAAPASRTARQERNRRYYEKKASEKHLSKTVQDVSDGGVSSPEVSPHTPLPNPSIHNPPSPPKGGSSPAGFDQFWAIYPNRVGKRDAEKAFAKAAKRASLETILAGLRRYVAKTDDRPWCNPSTWLNQDRWDDAPAEVLPQRQATPPPGKRMNAVEAYLSMRSEQNDEPASRTIDHRNDEQLPSDKPRLQALVGDLGQAMLWSDGSGHH